MEKIARSEVLLYLEQDIEAAMPRFLKPIDEMWQPADLLPDSSSENFFEQVKELREKAAHARGHHQFFLAHLRRLSGHRRHGQHGLERAAGRGAYDVIGVRAKPHQGGEAEP